MLQSFRAQYKPTGARDMLLSRTTTSPVSKTCLMRSELVMMLQLQEAMNSAVNPQWREQGNAWYRAIWVECAELLDHYGWKWWKAQQPDLAQVELELIDIWHFGLSALLESGADDRLIAEDLEHALREPVAATLDFRRAIEDFALTTLSTKTFDLQGFAQLMSLAGLSFETLFRSYVGKNVLNIFRQHHGYRLGSYLKLWGGKEDNEHLVDIMSAMSSSELSQERIYRSLEERYQAFVQKTLVASSE